MTMSFLGSRIIDEVIGELIRSPKYQFLHAKFVLLAGSSAGAAGVMINLDRVAKQIADSGSMADVRGLADSGWIMDMDDQQQSSSKSLSTIITNKSTSGCCVGDDNNIISTGTSENCDGSQQLSQQRHCQSCCIKEKIYEENKCLRKLLRQL